MLLFLLQGAAHASATYPAAISTDVGAPCAFTQCTLCHSSNIGGLGTVVTPFGLAMMDAGLTGGLQNDLVPAALDVLAADGFDSDSDGVSDVDELAAGDDPAGGTALCDAVTPIYGCVNHTPGLAGALGLVLAAAATRRRR
jgi:hypothetical protein